MFILLKIKKFSAGALCRILVYESDLVWEILYAKH